MEKVIFDAKEGETVGPVSHEDLFYIFIVDRKIPALTNPKYSDFAKEVKELAVAEKLQEQLRAKRNALFFKAAVETSTDVLDRVEWPESPEETVKAPHGRGH
jgi:parvulin-like peptidyl-prolyl isomerase